MPFKSTKQQRWMFAAASRGEIDKDTVKHWAKETTDQPGGFKALPEYVDGKPKDKAKAKGKKKMKKQHIKKASVRSMLLTALTQVRHKRASSQPSKQVQGTHEHHVGGCMHRVIDTILGGTSVEKVASIDLCDVPTTQEYVAGFASVSELTAPKAIKSAVSRLSEPNEAVSELTALERATRTGNASKSAHYHAGAYLAEKSGMLRVGPRSTIQPLQRPGSPIASAATSSAVQPQGGTSRPVTQPGAVVTAPARPLGGQPLTQAPKPAMAGMGAGNSSILNPIEKMGPLGSGSIANSGVGVGNSGDKMF